MSLSYLVQRQTSLTILAVVIAPQGQEGWQYYEDSEDGSLSELLEGTLFQTHFGKDYGQTLLDLFAHT